LIVTQPDRTARTARWPAAPPVVARPRRPPPRRRRGPHTAGRSPSHTRRSTGIGASSPRKADDAAGSRATPTPTAGPPQHTTASTRSTRPSRRTMPP